MNDVKLTSLMRKRWLEARNKLGFTQTKLAKEIGTNQSHISRIEDSENRAKPPVAYVSHQEVDKLSKLSGFSREYLLGDSIVAHQADISTNEKPLPVASQMTESREKIISSVLSKTYPRDYAENIGKAKTLWMSGFNLRRIINIYEHIDAVEAVLKNLGSVRALLLDRGSKACKFAAIQDWGTEAVNDVGDYIDTVTLALNRFAKIQRVYNRLVIKTIDYALPFGLDIINAYSSDGIIYVRFYPFYWSKGKDPDRPIIVLRAGDGYWYDFYREQFELMWDNKIITKPWPHSSKPRASKNKL
jgi:transcriptional regulator with XRE-family HTH domain